MLTRFAAALLCPLLFAAHSARSQVQIHACTDQPRAAIHNQITAGQPSAQHSVSVRLLAIPEKAWQHYQKAAAATARNQPELAAAEAAKALALAPAFAEIYLLRALEAVDAGHPAEALPHFATARTLAPDLPWLRIAAAGALNQLHRFDQAITELTSIPGSEATSWQALYERARAEAGLGNLPVALQFSQLAVVAAPVGCTPARLLHANVLNLAGRHDDVIAELETYLSEDRLHTRQTEVQAALERLRLAFQITPSSEEVRIEKAQTSTPHGLDHSLLTNNRLPSPL